MFTILLNDNSYNLHHQLRLRWSNGRIIAFQAIGSGSTPDRCISLLPFNFCPIATPVPMNLYHDYQLFLRSIYRLYIFYISLIYSCSHSYEISITSNPRSLVRTPKYARRRHSAFDSVGLPVDNDTMSFSFTTIRCTHIIRKCFWWKSLPLNWVSPDCLTCQANAINGFQMKAWDEIE